MVSHTFYTQHTEEFYDFYKNKMIFLDAKPNKAHLKLAEMEQAGKLLRKISTGFIRQQEVKMSLNCTAVFTETIARNAASSSM
jgi:hypothetical protein